MTSAYIVLPYLLEFAQIHGSMYNVLFANEFLLINSAVTYKMYIYINGGKKIKNLIKVLVKCTSVHVCRCTFVGIYVTVLITSLMRLHVFQLFSKRD